MSFNGDLRESLEILGIRGNDNVHILRSADHSPGVHRKAAHQKELDIRLGESAEKLVEGWLGQLRRAAPVNCISWWLRAMPSARFTFIGRRASSRKRLIRTSSPAAAAFFGSPGGCLSDSIGTR